MSTVDNPLKWLLTALPDYVPSHLLPVLMHCYAVNKKAYERQIAIRSLERKIKNAQHWPPSDERTIRLARWETKLATLKEADL